MLKGSGLVMQAHKLIQSRAGARVDPYFSKDTQVARERARGWFDHSKTQSCARAREANLLSSNKKRVDEKVDDFVKIFISY